MFLTILTVNSYSEYSVMKTMALSLGPSFTLLLGVLCAAAVLYVLIGVYFLSHLRYDDLMRIDYLRDPIGLALILISFGVTVTCFSISAAAYLGRAQRKAEKKENASVKHAMLRSITALLVCVFCCACYIILACLTSYLGPPLPLGPIPAP